MKRRLAIIGGGSSGLITLKFALEMLADWEIQCFEKSDAITGCWGNPHADFTSTSTKYTTQFACYPQYDASIQADAGASRSEFFRGDEFGRYLQQFAEFFELLPHIRTNTPVARIRRGADDHGWVVEHSGGQFERFEQVIICTGLAAEIKPVQSRVEVLRPTVSSKAFDLESVRNRRVLVLGGGESAADFANRLSRADRGNQVFLSLRSGIRVSPRYHPIRGVPSDFLRNRLMLSIHKGTRNFIANRFVNARIRYRTWFERLFPSSSSQSRETLGDQDAQARRQAWDFKLTSAAKGDVFNMFHNKSDDFLDAVACERIQIVGPPIDEYFQQCKAFDSEQLIDVNADLIVPAIGYRSHLQELSGGCINLQEFYWGCCHQKYHDLHLVGFARPVIGSIPPISEMQARYVVSMIAGRVRRPDDIVSLNEIDRTQISSQFAGVDLACVYPVEMIPYCDRLARRMNALPSLRHLGSIRDFFRVMLSPASTLHYRYDDAAARRIIAGAPVYMPRLLIAALLVIKPIGWLCSLLGKHRVRR